LCQPICAPEAHGTPLRTLSLMTNAMFSGVYGFYKSGTDLAL
jgi:hypothetical protein